MSVSERGLRLGLRALNSVAGLELLDRIGARDPLESLLRGASRTTARAGRTFATVQKRGKGARPSKVRSGGVFDVTPTDEQQMLRDSFKSFATERLRPAAATADAVCEAPEELLSQSVELGTTMLGVPESHGGVFSERSTVTSTLIAETLAYGDVGLAASALAPSGVSTALGLWGDASQQATYLPSFVGDDPPAAAFALLEPRPLFDPGRLETRARRVEGGYSLAGVKSLVPRAATAELFVVAAELEGTGPALFIVESAGEGIFVEPEPAMGVRAAGTSRVTFDNTTLPAEALLAEGDPGVFDECVHRARLAWCGLAVGCAQAVLDYVIPYVNERVAFGEPVSNRQAVAFTVANIGIELEGMRLLTYRAASRADREETFMEEVSLARQLCVDKGMAIGSDGVQMLGGHGYVKEHPVERWYRDLRAIGVMEGALLV